MISSEKLLYNRANGKNFAIHGFYETKAQVDGENVLFRYTSRNSDSEIVTAEIFWDGISNFAHHYNFDEPKSGVILKESNPLRLPAFNRLSVIDENIHSIIPPLVAVSMIGSSNEPELNFLDESIAEIIVSDHLDVHMFDKIERILSDSKFLRRRFET
jgi:hypothetical protein